MVIGAVEESLSLGYVQLLLTGITVTGTVWFTPDEGNEMVELVSAGELDPAVWKTQSFPLAEINDALQTAASRLGGFVNVTVSPTPALNGKAT